MQKRFNPKDFLLLGILGILFITMLVTMYMIDRQWQKLSEMETSVSEQSRDIRQLRKHINTIDKRISSGGVSTIGSNGTNANIDDIPDSFRRAQLATQLPDYAEGDWLVRAISGKIKTLTPLVSSDRDASDVQSFVIETLLVYDPDTLELIGHIAESWTISDDGLVFTYKMREDVTFSDGVPMTAEDIVFTFDFIMDERIAAPRDRAYYKKLKSVKALDKYTVEFILVEPYYNALLLTGSISILAKHHYGPYLDNPTEFNESKGYLFGSGPYRLKDSENWTSDTGIVELVRNSRYWGPVNPSYDRILWKVIENPTARLTTFRNGGIDMYGARPIEYETLLKDKDIMSKANNIEYTPAINSYVYIGWNQKRKDKKTLFSDKRVRQAMTYLTDRNKIINEIFLGYGEIAVSPFNPNGSQHDVNILPREHNIDKAIALLKEAGFEDRNGDGVIEDADGTPFIFELTYVTGSEDSKRTVLMLKDAYARAGIIVKPKQTEWPIMLENVDKKDFDAILLGWTSVVETDLYQIFHSAQSLSGGDNYVSYSNKNLDKYIEQARNTVDKDTRMTVWHKCEKFLYEDQPYTFLFRRKSLVFIDKRIHNVNVTKFGLNTRHLPIEHFVPTELQRYTK